jgi:hypothetical protein
MLEKSIEGRDMEFVYGGFAEECTKEEPAT